MGLLSFLGGTDAPAENPAPVYFFNTLGKEKQLFETLRKGHVKTYTCGPTPYDRMHIGNMSSIVFADVLRRALEWNGYTVKQVTNVTDFGHLVSDGDTGEDKMSKGLRREGKTFTMENMLALAKKYANVYFEDARALGVDTDAFIVTYASDYIDAQIALIKTLEEKGYAYVIEDDGVYFDVSRFPTYGELAGTNIESLKAGARVEVNEKKRHPADFALWKFGSTTKKSPGWESPWGKGFPGWHIECSAMIRSNLGEQIDIHTGGPEHIAVHHTNEIAQSEAAFGKHPFSRYWLHRAWIQMEGEKISKSLGNTYYVSDIVEHGFHPLAYRYWLLTSHYRTPSNFTWAALEGAQKALVQLVNKADSLADVTPTEAPAGWLAAFRERINDDLDTPGAVARTWELVKDKTVEPSALKAALIEADSVFGLNVFQPDDAMRDFLQKEFGTTIEEDDIPDEIKVLMAEREAARLVKNWSRADEIRDTIKAKGFEIEDAATGPRIVKK